MVRSGSGGSRRPTEPKSATPQSGLGGWAVAVLIGALALRLLYVASISHAYFFEHLQTEPLRYHQWATLILDGPTAPRPPFDQAPGYPYLVAAVYRLFGRRVTAVAVVQAALGALACVLIAFVGERFFGRRAGLVAGVLAAVYGPFLYFVGELEPTTAFVCVVLLAMSAALLARGATAASRPPRAGAWVFAGSLWGVALVLRAEALLAVPFVLVDAWVRGGRRALGRTVAPLVLSLAAMVAVNAVYSHRLVFLTTTSGLNLWLGNNRAADGVNPFIAGPLEAVVEDVSAHAHDPVEADALFRQRTLEFWRTEPERAAALMWKKLLWTFARRELPNTGDIEWQTAHSWLFRPPLVLPGLGVVLPLAVLGAVLLGRGWRTAPLLLGPVAIGVGTSLVFFTNARFRMPMAITLILLAGYAIARLPGVVADARERRVLLAGLAGAGLAAVVAWGDFYGSRTYRIPQISVNTGILEREAGDLRSAVVHLREGLTATPDDALAWTHLALALEQLGEPRAALEAYLDGLAAAPRDPSLPRMAARFLQRRNVDPNALRPVLLAATYAERRAAAADLLDTLGAAGGGDAGRTPP